MRNYPDNKLFLISNLSTSNYYFSEKPWGTEIIIPVNRIKDDDEKKKIYKSLAEYYSKINGGRFTEFLSRFYRGEIK